MQIRHLLSFLFLLLLFSACQNTNSTITKNTKASVNQRLHDIWIVKKINGEPADKTRKTPVLEINLTTMKIYGNDGCNEFSGDIKSISDTKIQLHNLERTQIGCENMQQSTQFNTNIQQAITYQLKDLNLIFFDKDGKELLLFLKGD